MATIYRNPTLKERPDNPGAPEAGYSGYIEPDTNVPPKARPVTTEISVNGTVIPEDTVLAEAQNHPAETPGEAVRSAARALVIRELLLQEAVRKNVPAHPETETDGRRETAEDALIRALIEQEVAVPQASEVECRRYFDRNRRRFTTAPLFEARHILLAARPDDAAARGKAREQAETLCRRLADDPSAFSEAAAAYSACSSSNEGGRLGQIGRGETVPAFEEALETLREGAITEAPVETDFGFHVIALDRRIDGCALPFEDVRDRIAAWLEASSWSRAVSQYISVLSAAAEVKGIDLNAAEGPLVQ